MGRRKKRPEPPKYFWYDVEAVGSAKREMLVEDVKFSKSIQQINKLAQGKIVGR